MSDPMMNDPGMTEPGMSGSGDPMARPMYAMPAEAAGPPPEPLHGEAALPGEQTSAISPVEAERERMAAEQQPRTAAEPVPMAPGGRTGRMRGGRYAEPYAAEPYAAAPMVRAVPTGGMLLVGVLTLLVGAWAGIAVFAGPTFGWDAGGPGAWTWNLVRAVVHAVPGIAAVLAGLLMIAGAPGWRGRSEATLGGLIAVLAGAWLVIGPSSWPLFSAGGAPFGAGGGLRGFSYVVGANLGPGLLLAVLGAMALAWGLHRPRTAAAPAATTAPMAPVV